jgi:hypothetical protein
MDNLQSSESVRERIAKTFQELNQLSEESEGQDKSHHSNDSQVSSLSVTNFDGSHPQSIHESPTQDSKSSKASSDKSEVPPQNIEANLKSSQKSDSSQSDAPKGWCLSSLSLFLSCKLSLQQPDNIIIYLLCVNTFLGPNNLVSLIPAMNSSSLPTLENQPPQSESNNTNPTKERILSNSPSSERIAPVRT